MHVNLPQTCWWVFTMRWHMHCHTTYSLQFEGPQKTHYVSNDVRKCVDKISFFPHIDLQFSLHTWQLWEMKTISLIAEISLLARQCCNSRGVGWRRDFKRMQGTRVEKKKQHTQSLMSSWKQPYFMKHMVADVVQKMCQSAEGCKAENLLCWERVKTKKKYNRREERNPRKRGTWLHLKVSGGRGEEDLNKAEMIQRGSLLIYNLCYLLSWFRLRSYVRSFWNDTFPILACESQRLSLDAISIPNRVFPYFSVSQTIFTKRKEKGEGWKNTIYIYFVHLECSFYLKSPWLAKNKSCSRVFSADC